MSELFVLLLNDESRWVRLSAYQELGKFIASFTHHKEQEEGLFNHFLLQIMKKKIKTKEIKMIKKTRRSRKDPSQKIFNPKIKIFKSLRQLKNRNLVLPNTGKMIYLN